MRPALTSWMPFARDLESAGHQLLVSVPCAIGGLTRETHALLDTGSEWSVLEASLIRALDIETRRDRWAPVLHTRFGRVEGQMERLSLHLRAEEGESLRVEVAWFVSQDWFGPTVVGWRGCLEHLRFAVDPGEDRFYFGEL